MIMLDSLFFRGPYVRSQVQHWPRSDSPWRTFLAALLLVDKVPLGERTVDLRKLPKLVAQGRRFILMR